ncbi:MAG: Rrf2 family transcriptional regulator [Verrucomicrobiae bacterium]|nr:Rrf2 family transcriptional regulator [Verrucomicrobiae bacterium]
MRLPLKTEYACQVMAQLARTYENGEVRRVEELAEAEGLSPNYLVQILTQLRPMGLVISKRGKNGGYLLGRDPKTISLAEIVSAMEGEDLIESSSGNGGKSAAKVNQAWNQVNRNLRSALEAISLTELIPDESNAGTETDWVI